MDNRFYQVPITDTTSVHDSPFQWQCSTVQVAPPNRFANVPSAFPTAHLDLRKTSASRSMKDELVSGAYVVIPVVGFSPVET